MLADQDYARVCQVLRFSVTFLIPIETWETLAAARTIPQHAEIYQNLVEGGMESLPAGFRFLSGNYSTLVPLIIGTGLIGLLLLWRSKRLPGILLSWLVTYAILQSAELFINHWKHDPLMDLISKFQG